MGIQQISVVSDTGPLIHLSEIGCINFLKYFEIIYVPGCVRSEYYKHKKKSDPDAFDLENIQLHLIEDIDLNAFISKNYLSNLHSGEKECLFLCSNFDIDVILTDDLAVRDVAKRLNITPVGSLGVIVKSYKKNVISLSQAEKHILQLYEISSLYVTKTIIELVIDELRKC